jgi:hypothetical protein
VVPLAAAISDQHLSGGNTRRVDGRTAHIESENADSPIAAGGLKNQCVDAHMHARLLSGSRFFPYRCARDDFH